ncbi:MAG: 50S ribosomal protein L5 [Nanoarchaeota archaeon]|nr:50S ribosomal protein L5 [Nanoarchaeota archaeon]
MKNNIMRKIHIEKITLNIGVGESGDKLDKAVKILNKIAGQKPVKTKTFKRIPGWNIRPKLEIAAKVTIRKNTEKILKKLFNAVENKLQENKFDNNGNFSFGIGEYINIPGIEYDIDVGIIGLDIAVTLERPCFRIKRRLNKSKIKKSHKITKEEAIEFIKNKFDITITKKGEE